MAVIIFIIAFFTAIRWATYKKDDFESKTIKQKFGSLLRRHWVFYSFFSTFALLTYFSQVAEDAVKSNQPASVELKQEALPEKPKFEDAEFFYIKNDDDGTSHTVQYKFTYSKIGEKYAVFLKNPVSKDDYITSQIFLGAVSVIYREILDSHGGDPSKMFELVPLDVPKNQFPKPVGKMALRSKLGNSYFYISNLAASDGTNSDVQAFVVWKEAAE